MPRYSQTTPTRPAGTLQKDSLHSTPLRRRAPTTQLRALQSRTIIISTPQSRLPPVTEYWDDDDLVQYIAADPAITNQPTEVKQA